MSNNHRQELRDLVAALARGERDPVVAARKNVNWENLDVDVERSGKKIVLPGEPGPMGYDEAIAALERKKEDENQTFFAFEVIEGFPLDVGVQFVRAIAEIYGWASPVPTPGFFGPRPPQMLSVRTGPGPHDFIQVPFGSFKIPGIEEPIELGMKYDPNKGAWQATISGTVKKFEQHVLLDLANETRRILKEHSIYKGKALTVNLQDHDGRLTVSVNNPPQFMNTDVIDVQQLILGAEAEAQVKMSIFTPIEETEACRKHSIPLKRGVLLYGPYGTGKSLAARTTAKIAVDNGWTFINIDNVAGLRDALIFAQAYAPAVVFAEDIDRVLAERDDAANDLVNHLDGVLHKDAEVMVVLTSNHADRINPVMLRPGRLDALISIGLPDEYAAGRLVTQYARGLIAEGEDISSALPYLAQNIPATIREIVERAKLGMIGRGASSINADDLIVSALSMQAHLTLLNRPMEEETAAEKLASSLREVLRMGVTDDSVIEEIIDVKDRVTSNAGKVVRALGAEISKVGEGTAGAIAASEKRLTNEIRNAI